MNPWPFVVGAYAIMGIGMAGIAGVSWRAMRRAERAVEALRRR
ncbi:heme exporter protein CcmD [Stakelama sp. CBK3Z-3]|uniref:Heme exporter protein D n=1 Tax=Stakelama flava TaxID=2860338 RepID=A0ABS6XH68_9SPHN|nr:heme exporter protein CcmD [Stakelama flava]MBW4329553.1 heme exporter protein CcmD [Stakelama flava]